MVLELQNIIAPLQLLENLGNQFKMQHLSEHNHTIPLNVGLWKSQGSICFKNPHFHRIKTRFLQLCLYRWNTQPSSCSNTGAATELHLTMTTTMALVLLIKGNQFYVAESILLASSCELIKLIPLVPSRPLL